MRDQVIILCVTAFVLLLLIFLFHVERSRGSRFFAKERSRFDFFLLRVHHAFNVKLRNKSRYFFRQIVHYVLHTILTGLISSLSSFEEQLKNVARSNRILAKKSDKERTQRNALEEIALHKLEMALSDEEKRIRKQKSIE